MEVINNVVYFESDDDFTDFCVKPYALIVASKNGRPKVEGYYTDEYLDCLEQGKIFIIKDENSLIEKRKMVTKRVPIKVENFPAYQHDTLVQLEVQNVEPYFCTKNK